MVVVADVTAVTIVVGGDSCGGSVLRIHKAKEEVRRRNGRSRKKSCTI